MILVGTGISIGTGIGIGVGAAAPTSGIVTAGLQCLLDPVNYPGSDIVIPDTSGNLNDGIIATDYSGAPTYSAGPPASFVFNRISDVFNAGKIVVPNMLGSDMTVSAWINSTGTGAGTLHYTFMYIVSAEAGGAAADWGMGVNAAGNIAFGTGYSDITIAGGQVNTGAWVNVVATRVLSTGLISLYINGVLSNADYGEAETVLTDNPDIWIGSGADTPAYSFGGQIGGVLLYNQILTSTQILQNFNADRSKYGV